MTLLERVSDYLRQHGIAHALIGAAALAVHGVSRSTLDQDLLVTDQHVLDDGFWTGFDHGAAIEQRLGDSDDPLAGVVRIEEGDERDVDLVVGRDEWQRDILQRSVALGEPPGITVALPADLVLLKLYAGGSQDKWDIEQLLSMDDVQAVVNEVDALVTALPRRCVDLWATVRPKIA